MTSFDLYIGDLDDPNFHWEGGNWNGNSPRGATDVHVGVDRFTFGKFTNKIGSGGLPGKQTDWGCWVVIPTAVIIDLYAPNLSILLT